MKNTIKISETSENDPDFTEEEKEYYMKKALKLCEKAIEDKEVPVSCIFVHIPTKQIISMSHNLTNYTKNASAHCEINCIKKIENELPFKVYKDKEKKNLFKIYSEIEELMSSCALFVTIEPCIMCAYALSLVNIKKVYFGGYNEKFGGNGSILSLNFGPGKSYISEGGIMKDEAIKVLRDFYSMGNENAPDNKRQRKLKN